MALQAGSLDQRLTFRRRAPLSLQVTDPPQERAGFTDYGQEWGAYADRGEQETDVGPVTLRPRRGIITIRANNWTRTLTSSDRVVVNGGEFEITSISQGPRRDGSLKLNVLEAPTEALYEAAMDQRGEVVVVRRNVPNAPAIAIAARAIVSSLDPTEIASGIDANMRRIAILAKDLEEGGFPLPMRETDKVVVRGVSLNVSTVDHNNHRIAGDLVAIEVRAAR